MDPKLKPFHLKILLGVLSVFLGSLFRTIIAKGIFLQPDEEIFGYIAFQLTKNLSLEYLISSAFHWLGYPLVLSLWFRIFGISFFSARMFSVMCSGITIGIIYIILLKITKEARYAFIGSLLFGILPFPLRYGHMMLTEPFVWVFISSSILLLMIAWEKDRSYLFFLSGILMFLAASVRRSALIMLFVMVPFLIWINRQDLKRMAKRTLSWSAGMVAPVISMIAFLLLHYGYERLEELKFTRIPGFSSDLSQGPLRLTNPENFVFATQPVVWYSLTLILPMFIGGGILLMAIHKNRWKPVYIGAFLWPVLVRLAFSQELSPLAMMMIMVLPLLVLLQVRNRSNEFHLCASILLGSSAAFSSIYLSGTIWNVIIYCSAGAMALMYLSDRMNGAVSDGIFLVLGSILLFMMMAKEPQVLRMIRYALPVIGISYGISLMFTGSVPQRAPLIMTGIGILMIVMSRPWNPYDIVSFILILVFITLIVMGRKKEKAWRRLRYSSVLLIIASLMLLPDNMPLWGSVIPVMAMLALILSGIWRTREVQKIEVLLTGIASISAFTLAYLDSRSILLSGIAMVLVGGSSALLPRFGMLSSVWKSKVPERISILLILMIFGYLAFYIYYLWREVYFTEFLFQAVIIAGILLWILLAGDRKVRYEKGERKIKRIVKEIKVPRYIAGIFLLFLFVGIPLSTSAYLGNHWFMEEPMDQRPYMRTIEGIAEWIVENTDEDDKIVAWHCYALEANRETLMEISNAKVYDGKRMIRLMEEENATVFVRCYYTNHGLWNNQPLFQEYVKSNYYLDKVIDGNECWLRMPPTSL